MMQPNEVDALAWRPETARSVDAMGPETHGTRADDDSRATMSTTQNEVRVETSSANGPGDDGILDMPVQSADEFDFVYADPSFGTTSMFADIPWTDLFSDYFPAQNGIENASFNPLNSLQKQADVSMQLQWPREYFLNSDTVT